MNFLETINRQMEDRQRRGGGSITVDARALMELVRSYEVLEARDRASHLVQEMHPMVCRQRLHAVVQDAYHQLGAEDLLLDVAAAIKPLADEKRKREISIMRERR